MFVASLRAFLRFRFLEGFLEVDLSGATLSVPGRRRSSLPRGVPVLRRRRIVGDIARLVDAAHALQPRLKGLTFGTLFGLLASSGLRVGEAPLPDRE